MHGGKGKGAWGATWMDHRGLEAQLGRGGWEMRPLEHM